MAYYAAYQDLDSPTLPTIQKHIDDTIRAWATDEADRAGVIDEIESNTKRLAEHPTNLQILTGYACDGSCFCCFIRNNPDMDPEDKAYVQSLKPKFDMSRFFLAALYARMNYGLTEALFSSYGDPLSQPLAPQLEQIRIVKELGYSQITLLTNGINLNANKIDLLVDAGLTNLTVSLHTSSPEKHNQIVMEGKDPTGKTHKRITQLLRDTREKHPNLIIRINVAYSDQTEDMTELIAWAKQQGFQQISFIEMIPANPESVASHRPLPDSIPGFELKSELRWGMKIFTPSGEDPEHPSISVALCPNFGDAQFEQQPKNIMFVNIPDPVLKLNPLYKHKEGDKIHYH